MKRREQIEDTIQSIVCKLLPKMNPSDIRPAYQEYDTTSKIIAGENSEITTTGFTPQDNFIYITAKIGTGNALTSINNNGDVSSLYGVDVTFTFYGEQSAPLSLCLFSLLEIDKALMDFQMFGMYLHKKDNEILEMHEIINEQWFERHEFSVTFLISEDIKSPFSYESVSSNGVDAYAIISMNGNTVETNILKGKNNVGKSTSK